MLTTLRDAAATRVLSAAAFLLGVVAACSPVSAQDMQWSKLQFPESGISLRVPLGVFEALPVDDEAQGRLFVSRDGKAQLLVGAFENADGRSLSAHQKFVIASNYASAEIDYAPLRRNWFVLSGDMDSRTFYQRVTFTCGGRLINSWAMIYPTGQKRLYDRIIERMHSSFRAGRGPDGDCRLAAATN